MGAFVQATVDPLERDQNDSGVDRRLTRFLAFLSSTAIPAGHVHVFVGAFGPGTEAARVYDMTNILSSSIEYTALVENLSFSVSSMAWTVNGQHASFP